LNNIITISLKEVPFKCHVFRRVDGLCGVCMADNEYNEGAAHRLISKCLTEFDKVYTNKWKVNKDTILAFDKLNDYLKEYQDPKQADNLLKVQQHLDDIKDIMHKNLEEILKRGETLDNLLQKSEDIGEVSKMFHSKAKKTNQCCQWM